MDKITVEQARTIRGLSRKEVAKRLKMSISTYRNKELGITEFKVNEAIRFSDIIGIPITDIIF